MVETILKDAEKAVNWARRKISSLLDVADVPDEHQINRKVNSAFISLEDVLQDVPRVGRTAAAVFESTPVVYPIQGRDPRDWPTSEGAVTGVALIPNSRRASRIAAQERVVIAKEISARRAISSTQYLRALEDANSDFNSPITEVEDLESFTTVLP